MAETKPREKPAKPPITSHPLFPVTVVLWFGALFGLCSVAIRSGLIEHAVLVSGIDHVIPMAAPPLGNTMRILLTLMMTALGCMVGVLVAKRLAKPLPQQAARRRRSTPASTEAESPVAMFGRKSIAPQDDEGASPDVDDAPVTVRRRQLAITTPDAEDVPDLAPLPGGAPILQVADLELESFDAAFDDDTWLRRRDPAEPAPATATAEDATAHSDPADQPDAAAPRGNRLFDAYVQASRPIEPETSAQVPAPGFDLLAQSFATPEPTVEERAPAPITANEPADEQPATGALYGTAAERIASAPLDALSHVELLERLALTIARRRAAVSAQTAPADEAPEASLPPRPSAAVFELPAALRAVTATPDEDDDALPVTVPARSIARSSSTPLPGTDEAALAAGLASLRGVQQQQPVIAFPSPPTEAGTADDQASRAFDGPRAETRGSDQTETALRAALATLQRMSGAA